MIKCTMYNVQDYSVLYNNTVRLVVKICILLTCGKQLHDNIISLRGEMLAHKTSISPPRFIEVPVPSQKIDQSCICVYGVSILPLSTILIFDFGIVPTVWYFLLFILFQ